MRLPTARGPLSRALLTALSEPPGHVALDAHWDGDPSEACTDDDLQLSLWVLYELHYRGFEDCDPSWEWDPRLLAVRARLEKPFLAALRDLTEAEVGRVRGSGDSLHRRLLALIEDFDGPSLASYVQRSATREQFLEFLVQRSIYHLKESDPHSFVIARLEGAAKTRLVELQYDEYGGGRPERLHSTLFAGGLRAAGLDDAYGAYVEQAAATTFAVSNAMSLFCLHRSLRGAAMGHLAAFESTSSIPCRRVVQGVGRLGLGDQVAEYFDEHVEADAVHEEIALREICGVMAAEDPSLEESILFGAATCLALEALDADRILDAWTTGGSSLRQAERQESVA